MFETERYGIKFFPSIQYQKIDLDSLIDRILKINNIYIIDSYKPLFIIIKIADYDVECKIKYDGSITMYFNNTCDFDNMLSVSNSVICFLRNKNIICSDLSNSSQFIYHGSNEKINSILKYISYKLDKTYKIKLNRSMIYVRNGCLLVPGIPT